MARVPSRVLPESIAANARKRPSSETVIAPNLAFTGGAMFRLRMCISVPFRESIESQDGLPLTGSRLIRAGVPMRMPYCVARIVSVGDEDGSPAVLSDERAWPARNPLLQSQYWTEKGCCRWEGCVAAARLEIQEPPAADWDHPTAAFSCSPLRILPTPNDQP